MNQHDSAVARLIGGMGEDRDRSLARTQLTEVAKARNMTVSAMLRASGWNGEDKPGDAIIGATLEASLDEEVEAAQATRDFGERVDLLASYRKPPPSRDDVLLGLEPGNVMAIGAPGGGSKTFLLLALAHDLAFGGTI
jgi:hypothetical protein